jgi:hypothetical protein
MKYNSVQTFVPSGSDFQKSKELFLALGFKISWENDGIAGFENDGGGFILQKNDDQKYAENFMMSVKVSNLDEFWQKIRTLDLPEKFGVKIAAPKTFPWGREVNLIDIAGVCWHFSQGD